MVSVRRLFGEWYRRRLEARGYTVVSSKSTILPWMIEEYAERRIAERNPDVLIDVGANTGQFASVCRRLGYRGRIISFEPQPAVFAELKRVADADGNWACHPFALGDADGELPINVSGYSPSSSFLEIGALHTELMPHTRQVANVRVPVHRLDDVLKTVRKEGQRVAMKIDVQGYEETVLRGATETLACVDLACVELNFAPMFVGQSSWTKVAGVFEQSGFRLLTLTNIHSDPKTREYLWADGIFERPGGRPSVPSAAPA